MRAWIVTVALMGCQPAAEGPSFHTPLLSEMSATTDASVDVVDRGAELDGAVDAASASPGAALDLAVTGRGFRMAIDSEAEVQTADDDVRRAATYDHVLRGVAM